VMKGGGRGGRDWWSLWFEGRGAGGGLNRGGVVEGVMKEGVECVIRYLLAENCGR